MTTTDETVAPYCMFFAGLILLIPHRIGMSRVNYVIKRYNLPISRAGLLLYKFHNPIEVSLTIGTFFGNFIVWYGGGLFTAGNPWKKDKISIFMLLFLILILLSSIFMLIVYAGGDDYGHLNLFYFSLILITLFDGITNAFAFALNGKYSYMLSAGIPISGALVSILHNIYKLISDSFNWDDFDYYVLRLQLLLNILGVLFAFLLWTVDQVFDLILISYHNEGSGGSGDECDGLDFNVYNPNSGAYKFKMNNNIPCIHNKHSEATLGALVTSSDTEANYGDWSPICMLAISLGTVYAFYPSIAPYSIIDYQYASVIELWILIISAIPTIVIAVLDFIDGITFLISPGNATHWGPSGINNRSHDGTNPQGDFFN